MTAKGQLMPLGALSTGLNLRDKWQSWLCTEKWTFLVKSSQEGRIWEKGRSPPEKFTCSWEYFSAQEKAEVMTAGRKTIAKCLAIS